MPGAPRSAYADDDFVIIRGEAVRALGDYHSAGVFQRIAWRCERTGEWRATIARIAHEVWLTEKQVRRATAHLREVGWVTGEKTHPMDNTLTWRVTWADAVRSPGITERALGRMDRPTGRMDTPPGAHLPIRETETTTRDKGSPEPIAPERIAVLADLLANVDADYLDAEYAWRQMTADGIRHPDRFAADLDAAGEFLGYVRAQVW